MKRHPLLAPLFSPISDDEDQRRTIRLLLWIQAALLAALIAGSILSYLDRETDSSQPLLAAAGVVTITMLICRAGHPRASSFIFLLTMILVQTSLLSLGKGIHDTTMMAYAVVLMVASLTLGTFSFIIIVAASILSVGLVVYGEIYNLWTSPLSIYTNWLDFTYLSLILILAAFIARLLANNMFASLRRARENQRILSQMNLQLEEQSEKTRRAETRWLSMLVNAPDYIIELDMNGTILFVNLPDEALRKSTIGSSVYPFVPESYQETVKQTGQQALTTGETFRLEVPVTLPDNTVCWYSARLAAVPDAQPPRIILIVTDIDQRKKAEEQIQRLNAELEKRVRERTTEYENTNRELEAFAYSVSHDLRAPLRAINGFSQILAEDYSDPLGPEGKDSLARIIAATERMGSLIDDLLKLSRVTRSDLKLAPVNLSEAAEEILENFRQAEPQRQVEFHIQPDIIVEADANLLRIGLENLLSNAWKFTSRAAQARIEFGCAYEENQLVYFVRDNGAGFNMAYAEKLFRAFQRLHAPGEYEGTGIGLATVQRVIHRHGGKIWAAAQEGAGATFYFTLG